ncbi:hypothetical protein CBR_g12236 [Chara braunii]|uniref:Uncharacterized protein n=1 Tax=Chara braunii TaxID=69332 RepID=A0A388KRH6_CHABU|nr:hypothetical protein CBR_g12236 [Chara braunii]|eukprot:GBG72664.1 hypothetical protein CBR_g12236 [Chara braunii]
MQLHVLDLFLDCLTEENEKLIEFGMAGICNSCCDRKNAAILVQNGAIPLAIGCLTSPVEKTVLSAIATLFYLCNSSTRKEILTPTVAECMEKYAAARAVNVKLSNTAKAFLDKHLPDHKRVDSSQEPSVTIRRQEQQEDTADPPAPAVETATVEIAAAQTEAVETGAMETAAVETATVDTAAVEAGAMETAVVDTRVVETATVDTAAVKTAGVETPTVETAAVETAVAADEYGSLKTGWGCCFCERSETTDKAKDSKPGVTMKTGRGEGDVGLLVMTTEPCLADSRNWQLPRVLYGCSCGLLSSREDLFVCKECNQTCCRRCISEEIETVYCPSCLRQTEAADVEYQHEDGACNGSPLCHCTKCAVCCRAANRTRCHECADCPQCASALLTTAGEAGLTRVAVEGSPMGEITHTSDNGVTGQTSWSRRNGGPPCRLTWSCHSCGWSSTATGHVDTLVEQKAGAIFSDDGDERSGEECRKSDRRLLQLAQRLAHDLHSLQLNRQRPAPTLTQLARSRRLSGKITSKTPKAQPKLQMPAFLDKPMRMFLNKPRGQPFSNSSQVLSRPSDWNGLLGDCPDSKPPTGRSASCRVFGYPPDSNHVPSTTAIPFKSLPPESVTSAKRRPKPEVDDRSSTLLAEKPTELSDVDHPCPCSCSSNKLKPVFKQLVCKRTGRCPYCERYVIKPDPDPRSSQYVIREHTSGIRVLPLLTLRQHLPSPQSVGRNQTTHAIIEIRNMRPDPVHVVLCSSSCQNEVSRISSDAGTSHRTAIDWSRQEAEAQNHAEQATDQLHQPPGAIRHRQNSKVKSYWVYQHSDSGVGCREKRSAKWRTEDTCTSVRDGYYKRNVFPMEEWNAEENRLLATDIDACETLEGLSLQDAEEVNGDDDDDEKYENDMLEKEILRQLSSSDGDPQANNQAAIAYRCRHVVGVRISIAHTLDCGTPDPLSDSAKGIAASSEHRRFILHVVVKGINRGWGDSEERAIKFSVLVHLSLSD